MCLYGLPAHAAPLPDLLFEGNVVLPDEVYQAVLELAIKGDKERPSPARLEAVLLKFLRESGYALATVKVEKEEDGAQRIEIEEGRLDRVVFPGQGIGHTFQLRIALAMPGGVFNANVLNRKLAHLIETTDVDKAEYEVVPVHAQIETGNEWASRMIQGLRIIEPGQPHELHIYLDRQDFRPGLNVYVNYGAPDGLRVGLRYRGEDLLFENDRYRLLPLASLRVFEGVAGGKQSAGLSRLGMEAAYFTPPIAGDWLSVLVWTSADGYALRRLDLQISRYLFVPLRLAIGFDLHPWKSFSLSVGGGYQYRALLQTKAVTGQTPPSFIEEHSFSLFFGGELKISFTPEILRRDREHEIYMRALYNGKRGELSWFANLQAGYKNVFVFDYNELWLQAEAMSTLGDGDQFYDEISLGRFLRVAFGSLYARHAGALKSEYRLSIVRDVVKVGAFLDAAAFKWVDRGSEELDFAANLGLGFHLLMVDVLQLSLYSGVGTSTADPIAFGFGLRLVQAYLALEEGGHRHARLRGMQAPHEARALL